jgi:hypothetical protein
MRILLQIGTNGYTGTTRNLAVTRLTIRILINRTRTREDALSTIILMLLKLETQHSGPDRDLCN